MKLYSFLKYFINTLIFIVSLCVISNANAGSTYFGIDALYSNTRLKRDFGGNVFSRRMAPGVNFSLGHMFNNNFGAEVGFEIDDRNSATFMVSDSEAIFGIVNNLTFTTYKFYKSKINQNHTYLGIITKINIFNKNFISALIGMTMSKFKATTNYFGNEQILLGIRDFIQRDDTSIFNKNKIVPIAKIMFGYSYKNIYDFKIFCSWKNTAKIHIKSLESPANNPEIIKIRNTITFGFGLFYYI